MKTACLFLVVIIFAINTMAQNCAPVAMSMLSQYKPVVHSTSVERFRELANTSAHGTAVTNIIKAWNREYPEHPLQLQFCRSSRSLIKDFRIQYNVPYLWAGLYNGKGHCVLLIFKPDCVLCATMNIVNGIPIYHTERQSYKWAITNTYYIWKVK